MESKIKCVLNDVKYVSTTADIWSAFRRSFLGITCHWLDKNFSRCSAALSCKRFPGAHTFDAIGQKLSDCFNFYGLSVSKNIITVTDSAANFKKSFEEFGYVSVIEDHEIGDEINDDEIIEFMDVDRILSGMDDEDLIMLPKHHKCSCHMLALIPSSKNFEISV